MITKKGSHVGIVLSFVIFVTFVMFFYIMIRPSLATENKSAVLDTLKEKIIEMASAELTSVSVIVDSQTQPCAILGDFFDIGVENKIIILDEEGRTITAKKNNQDLYLDRESESDTFFKVYESEEFSTIDNGSISPCVTGNYEFGLVKNKTEIFETKILDIIERHEDDYEGLKQDLAIPTGNEFGLEFIYANGTNISTTNPLTKTNIFSREFPTKYIEKDADIKMGILRIKIW